MRIQRVAELILNSIKKISKRSSNKLIKVKTCLTKIHSSFAACHTYSYLLLSWDLFSMLLRVMSDCQKSVANKSAMQVQNLKSTLNEWKYVVALLDQVFLLFFNGQVIFLKGLNAADPIKSASARAGIYTTLYIILLVTKVRSTFSKPYFISKFSQVFSPSSLFFWHSPSLPIFSLERSMTR